jgi:AhpD family alkylhydroperoxidase
MANISFQQLPTALVGCMMHTENHINQLNIVETSIMELVRYYVSLLNDCAYCIDMHFKEAVAAGETQQRLHSVASWRDIDVFEAQERALLGWTKYVTLLTDSDDRQ